MTKVQKTQPKYAKIMNRHISEESLNGQKSFEEVINSVSLVIMEMQVQASLKLPSTRMPLKKNTKGNKCYWELKRDCTPFCWGGKLTQTVWEKCGASGSLDLAQGTAIPPSGYLSEERWPQHIKEKCMSAVELHSVFRVKLLIYSGCLLQSSG